MTKKEALDWLISRKEHYEMDDNCQELAEAIGIGIDAIKQELCEDAISRQAVLDVTWEEPSYTDALNVLTEVRDKVKALPPVNPQKPKSEWEHDHEILKAYSDGANDMLDKIRAEIDAARFLDKDKKLFKNANASGLEVAMDIIDKYAERSDKE